MSSQQHIIMNFSAPPSLEDLGVIADQALETMPHELSTLVDDLVIEIEDMPDDAIMHELELDDPFEIISVFRSGKEVSPGVEKKTAHEDDVLVIYRRPLLDMWCESCDDLSQLVRGLMIEELARIMDFGDEAIEEMIARHHQGML